MTTSSWLIVAQRVTYRYACLSHWFMDKNVQRWICMRFGKHGEKYIDKGAMRMVEQLEFRRISCLYRARCVNGVTSDRVLGENCKDRARRIKERKVRMGNVICFAMWTKNQGRNSGWKRKHDVKIGHRARFLRGNKGCMRNALTPLTSLLRLSPPKKSRRT